MRRDDGGDGSSRQIREGLLLAQRIVDETRPSGGAREWLDAVDRALLAEQARLDALGLSEDDRTTAGIATVRTELDDTRRWLRNLALKTAALLLVILAILARCAFGG